MEEILITILVCFIAGAGAGIGTGFAGMSAAAVIGPMLITFLGVPAYQACVQFAYGRDNRRNQRRNNQIRF